MSATSPHDRDMSAHRPDQLNALRAEIAKLYDYLQRIKHEIASIKHPRSEIDHFTKVADQLTAIVAATEEASNIIMESSKTIQETVSEMSEMVRYAEAQGHYDQITNAVNRIFEACAFQDITGQRISKIIKTMNLIEGTIASLIVIVGVNDVIPLPVSADDPLKRDDGVGLYGPVGGGGGGRIAGRYRQAV